jgi:hypothetical protein
MRKELRDGSQTVQTKSFISTCNPQVIIRRRRRSRSASGTPTESWEMVRARGHHDEVLNLVGARGIRA